MTLPSESALKIMLIEDYAVDIRGIGQFLADAGYSISDLDIYRTEVDAEAALVNVRPDLALVDLALPKEKGEKAKEGQKGQEVGLVLIKHIMEKYPEAKIVAIARDVFSPIIYRLLTYGVSFFAKSNLETPEVVRSLITSVMKGELIFSSAVVPVLREACKSAVRAEYDEADIKILKLVLKGKKDADIAKELNYVEDTIGKRLQEMFKRYGFRDRFQLANWFTDYVAPAHGFRFEDP
jgi:DNA-binding NarL/FixJ family response regulator